MQDLYNDVEILAAPHILPKIKDTTNFTQDITVHSDMTLLVTYIIMGVAWAGKSGLSFAEMLITGLCCAFMGVVIIFFEHFNVPTYIARFFGTLIASVIVLIIYQKTPFTAQIYSILLAIIMPVATGMLIVDGIYTLLNGKTQQGFKKVVTGTLTSVAIGGAVFIATKFVGI